MIQKYPFAQKKSEKIGLGIFLTVMLFLARDTNSAMYLIGFYPSQILGMAVFGAGVLAFLLVNRKDLKAVVTDTRVVIAAACAAMVLIPMLVKRDWQLMYLSILFCIFLGIFFSYFHSVRETARYYVCILTFLAAYSVLASYLFRIPADRGILVPPIFENSFQARFYNYGFAFVSIDFVKNRNFGIFREPGVYQYFLLLGIYLNNYRVDWQRKQSVWIVNGILGIAMLSTFATGGVIELGLFIVVLYLDQKWYRTRQGRILAVSAVGAVLAAAAFIVIQQGALYRELYAMVIKFFNHSDSITDRVGSFTVNLSLFFHSPLFGAGIAETLHSIANNTSSSTILLAILGVCGGTLNIAAWFALTWDRDRQLWANLALPAILAMAFNTENLIADTFFWLFPMMALTERILAWRMSRKG